MLHKLGLHPTTGWRFERYCDVSPLAGTSFDPVMLLAELEQQLLT